MDKGWLAYSEPELQWGHPGYTITRKTYSFAGRAIATRISRSQEGLIDWTNLANPVQLRP